MGQVRIWNPHYAPGTRGDKSNAQNGGMFVAHRKYHRKHHHRRHHNPFGVSGGAISQILWTSAGFVAARAVPAMALPNQNSGWMGYALNLGTAFLLKMFVPGGTGEDLFIGGVVATVSRVVSDQLGTQIKGLSGDPAFTLGAYWNSYFAVPTVSDPYGRVAASPYPQPALPAVATMKGYGGAAGSRAGAPSRFAAGRFG
jgi:hypothetical protein